MKQNYESPQVVVHGSVSELTAASNDSDRQDRIFNASGQLNGTGAGSLDQCFFEPDTYRCVIKE